MNYLLFTVGTVGDLNPYLALGEELSKRGHRVTLMTNPAYESMVGSVGLEFIPVGDQETLDRYLAHPDYFNAARSWKLALKACFVGPMRAVYDAIAERHATDGPTTLVSAAWGFGARIAHERLGIPLVTIHLEPHNIRSMHQTGVMPPPMMVGDCIPTFAKRIQFWMADRWFVDPLVCPQVNALRDELGLAPVQRVTHQWWNSPQQIIGMYPEWLVPRQPDWPPQLELTGFPLWDRSENNEVTDQAVEFARECCPIVFTAGSNKLNTSDFFQAAVKHCEALGKCGIFLGKQNSLVPNHLVDRIRSFRYVGFSRLLPHASAIVHHGGAGTTAQAIAAGIPQLVIPSVHGTPDIAARVKRIGVAESLKGSNFLRPSAAAVLRRLLESPTVAKHCRDYKERIQDDDAITRTCDLIEQGAR